MIRTTTSIRVRYAETDQMGIVYHGNYFTWLEVGRIRMLEELGAPYPQLEADGYKLPVLEVGFKYKSSARFDDEVIITTLMNERPGIRLNLEYELHCKGQLLGTGFSKHAFLNERNRPCRPPEGFELLMEQHFGKDA